MSLHTQANQTPSLLLSASYSFWFLEFLFGKILFPLWKRWIYDYTVSGLSKTIQFFSQILTRASSNLLFKVIFLCCFLHLLLHGRSRFQFPHLLFYGLIHSFHNLFIRTLCTAALRYRTFRWTWNLRCWFDMVPPSWTFVSVLSQNLRGDVTPIDFARFRLLSTLSKSYQSKEDI